MKTKAIILFVIFAICLFSFVGCEQPIDRGDAKNTVIRFFKAIKTDDYVEATALLHRKAEIDVQKLISEIEYRKRVDFNSDMIIHSFTEIEPEYGDKSYGYSNRCVLLMNMTVGGAAIEARFDIVKNSQGYGIINIKIK